MAATGTGAPGFLESFSPWPSRSVTPKPSDGKDKETDTAKLSNQKGADHSISHRHRLRLKDYPADCPKTSARWFYAVDVSTGDVPIAAPCLTKRLGREKKASSARPARERRKAPTSSEEVFGFLCTGFSFYRDGVPANGR